MKKFLYSLIALCVSFCSLNASIDDNYNFNPKNYIYDDNGNPVFVKVYIDHLKPQSSDQNLEGISCAVQNTGLQTLNLMTQYDERGSYLAIPIKSKKKKNNDDDEDDKKEKYWKCPYCGTENPPERNTCSNSNCVLHRKGVREKYGF